jgi:hypothetical protein
VVVEGEAMSREISGSGSGSIAAQASEIDRPINDNLVSLGHLEDVSGKTVLKCRIMSGCELLAITFTDRSFIFFRAGIDFENDPYLHLASLGLADVADYELVHLGLSTYEELAEKRRIEQETSRCIAERNEREMLAKLIAKYPGHAKDMIENGSKI